MKLYHGTTEEVARLAITQGLLPRTQSGVTGNWDHTVASNPDLVYLTNAYAPYFAAAASDGPVWGIVEVETDELSDFRLLPDEDFLEQATRRQDTGFKELEAMTSMKDRTTWFRANLGLFRHMWEDSIQHLGNCAYMGSIPVKAVTQVTLFDSRERPNIAMDCMDPAITLINYRFCGSKYRLLTQWIIGNDYEPQEEGVQQFGTEYLLPDTTGYPQMMVEAFEARAQNLRDRDRGITHLRSQ